MSITVKRFRIKLNCNCEIINILDLVNYLDTSNIRYSGFDDYDYILERLIDTILNYKLSKILRQLPRRLRSRLRDEAYNRYRSRGIRYIFEHPYRVSYYMAKLVAENCTDMELLKQT